MMRCLICGQWFASAEPHHVGDNGQMCVADSWAEEVRERQPSPALRHYLGLCMQGRRNGCSGGERAARQMAISMARHASSLDDTAVAGAAEFLRIASTDRRTAKMLIAYHGS